MHDSQTFIQKPKASDLFKWPCKLPEFLAPLFSEDLAPWDSLSEAIEAFKITLKQSAHTLPESVDISKHAELIHPELVWLEEGAQVSSFARIEGPAYIGKNVHIGHGALIRPGTILCEGARVGHASEVKASIFLPHAKAPHFNYVGNSLLGCDVNLGAGAILSNLRLDQSPITCKYRGVRFNTSHIKLGAILGDNVQVGCNVVLNPGTVLDHGTIIPPSKPQIP